MNCGNNNHNKQRQRLVLRPYQEQARSLSHAIPKALGIIGVGVWMDLGLGKTPTTLTVMDDSLHDYFDTQRWLVVGPKLVVQDSWPAQLDRWEQFEHLTYRIIESEDLEMEAGYLVMREGPRGGKAKEMLVRKVDVKEGEYSKRGDRILSNPQATRAKLMEMKETIHLVSWNNLPHLVKAYGEQWPYDGIVLDESEYVGDSAGLWHKAVRHVAYRLNKVNRVILLSGLPAPNGSENMHGQILLIDGGERLGESKEAFHEKWMEPKKKNWSTGQVYSWKVRDALLPAFHSAVQEVAFSMTGGVDLPEWAINDVPVTLKERSRRVYEALVEEFIAEVTEGTGSEEKRAGAVVEIVAASAGVLVSKLQQVCGGAVYGDDGNTVAVGTEKIDRLKELVEHLHNQDKPVVIAYLWDHEWPRIAKAFPGIKNIADKGVLAEAKTGGLKVVAGQCQSFSHGVDGLQHVFSDVIWFGPTYNYGTWEQLRKRLHRDGQKNPVMVHRLIARDTIEEVIANEVLPQKKSDAEGLLQAVNYLLNPTLA